MTDIDFLATCLRQIVPPTPTTITSEFRKLLRGTTRIQVIFTYIKPTGRKIKGKQVCPIVTTQRYNGNLAGRTVFGQHEN
jgi:hypothetical protein